MAAGYSTVVGDKVKIRLTIRVEDVLADPTTVVFTLELPDGSDETPTPVNESTGVWSCTHVVALGGYYRWRAVGDAPASFAREGTFYVAEISLASS